MEYTIHTLAELAGVSTRTLRYYDAVGLLRPCRVKDSGYRLYSSAEAERLQQILFYRELGVSLKEIAAILDADAFNALDALKNHREALMQRKEQLERLIQNVEKSILSQEGKIFMTDKERFEGFKKELVAENEQKYGEELREKYGAQCVEKSNQKLLHLSEREYAEMKALEEKILSELESAVLCGESPKSDCGQKIAQMHKKWLLFSWPAYSPKAHGGLAEMYTADSRFQQYYDKNVEGCAAFLKEAIQNIV